MSTFWWTDKIAQNSKELTKFQEPSQKPKKRVCTRCSTPHHHSYGDGELIEYAKVKRAGIDGIGREHAVCLISCDSCDTDFAVCKIHLPPTEEQLRLEQKLKETETALLELYKLAIPSLPTELFKDDVPEQVKKALTMIKEIVNNENKEIR